MKRATIYAITGLIIGFISSIFLTFSLKVQDALPLNQSKVQFNVVMDNEKVINRAEISYVSMNQWLFYPGMVAMVLSFGFQLAAVISKK